MMFFNGIKLREKVFSKKLKLFEIIINGCNISWNDEAFMSIYTVDNYSTYISFFTCLYRGRRKNLNHNLYTFI